MNRNNLSMTQYNVFKMRPSPGRKLWTLAALGLTLGVSAAFGQGAEELRMTVGRSVVIDYPSDVRQISTSNPEIGTGLDCMI